MQTISGYYHYELLKPPLQFNAWKLLLRTDCERLDKSAAFGTLTDPSGVTACLVAARAIRMPISPRRRVMREAKNP